VAIHDVETWPTWLQAWAKTNDELRAQEAERRARADELIHASRLASALRARTPEAFEASEAPPSSEPHPLLSLQHRQVDDLHQQEYELVASFDYQDAAARERRRQETEEEWAR
jgi:hypothetical protein